MSQPVESEYNFPVPGAARLASLVGLKSDMEQVVQYCDRMIERYAGSHLKKSPFDIVGFTTHVDFLDWEALSTAACISYARCFVSGVRQSLDANLLANAKANFAETHTFILNLRNKHIAHSVNSFEENSVSVHIGTLFQSSKEIRTVTPSITRSGLAFDAPTELRSLANWWIAKMREEITIEKANVLRIAQATPLDDIRSHGPVKSRSSAERNANVGKRRSNS